MPIALAALGLVATVFFLTRKSKTATGGKVLDVGTPPPPPPRAWTTADFIALDATAKRLGMNSADLLLILESESALNPAAAYRDKDGFPVAVGLNQLTRVSNAVTGLTEEQRQALVTQPVSVQIPIVERFFQNIQWTKEHRGYPNATTIYAINFAPGRLMSRGNKPNTVLYSKADGISYELNKSFDVDKKGYITVSDLAVHLAKVSKRSSYRGALAALRMATDQPQLSPRL